MSHLSDRKDQKKSHKIIPIVIVCVLLIVFFFAIPIALYEQTFGYYIPANLSSEQEAFVEEAKQTELFSKLFAGQQVYLWNQDSEKGVIVFSHGFGGSGFIAYMDLLKYFVEQDYCVIAYNAHGHGFDRKTETIGLPMGIADLDFVLDEVLAQEDSLFISDPRMKYKDIPVYLIGHSWGGYSVANVIATHPSIAGVCILSGFDDSKDMLFHTASQVNRVLAYIWTPVLNFYENIRVGNATWFSWTDSSAMEAFRETTMPVVVVHGTQDTVVPMQYGLKLWERMYRGDDRFTFMEYSDRGHNDIFLKDGRLDTELLDEIMRILHG